MRTCAAWFVVLTVAATIVGQDVGKAKQVTIDGADKKWHVETSTLRLELKSVEVLKNGRNFFITFNVTNLQQERDLSYDDVRKLFSESKTTDDTGARHVGVAFKQPRTRWIKAKSTDWITLGYGQTPSDKAMMLMLRMSHAVVGKGGIPQEEWLWHIPKKMWTLK